MTRSFYADTLPSDETDLAECFVTGVTEAVPAKWHVQPELGAAGVWTTPADLMRAQRGILASALGHKSDFLSQKLAQQGLKMIEGANAWTYGGWMSGKNWFGHGGSNNPGYRCQTLMCFDNDGKSQLGNAEGEGTAVMTNSALGQDVCLKVIQAIAYLRGWPGRDVLGLLDAGNVTPLCDPSQAIDGNWKHWKGKYNVGPDEDDDTIQKGQVLEIVEMEEDGEPCVKLDRLPGMKLVQAAMPPVRHEKENQKTIDLVVDGLDMMVTLTCNDAGDRFVQIWPGSGDDPVDCPRIG